MVDVRHSLVAALGQARDAGVPEETIKKILESQLPSLPKYRKARCSITGLVYITTFYLLPLFSAVALVGYGVWNYYQEYPCYYFVPSPLQEIYMSNPDSLENDKTNGQFFQYNSNIRNLNELFSMSEDSARFKTEKWYIGW